MAKSGLFVAPHSLATQMGGSAARGAWQCATATICILFSMRAEEINCDNLLPGEWVELFHFVVAEKKSVEGGGVHKNKTFPLECASVDIAI